VQRSDIAPVYGSNVAPRSLSHNRVSPGELRSSVTAWTALHVVGKPKNAADCAIARYLWALVGTEQSVRSISVWSRRVQMNQAGRNLSVNVSLPKPVSDFIRAFDSATRSS
jgi:hypothetical protein